IGREIENPFGRDENDLPLDKFCEGLEDELNIIKAKEPPRVEEWVVSERNEVMSGNSYMTLKERSVEDIRAGLRARTNVRAGTRREHGSTADGEKEESNLRTSSANRVRLREKSSYSQAVRVGDRIECAGQGGWDSTSGEIKKVLYEEIDQAFENVDRNLKDAGGKGWSQVFRVNSYHTDMSDEALRYTIQNLKEWMPDHQPLFTCVGVTKLGIEGMRIEIEVSAYDEEGAEVARKARADKKE
ncbi:MAG: hypothetical protein Q9204_006273, partial [Flavoplaca sp. TL-2023a]